jgi:hypothetical protein
MEEFDDRDDLSTARGIYNGCKLALVFYAIIALMIYACSACSAKPVITRDTGEVVNFSVNWVEVAYDVVNRPGGNRALNIYYKPCGHHFSIGDLYPDRQKEILCGY